MSCGYSLMERENEVVRSNPRLDSSKATRDIPNEEVGDEILLDLQ
jgi:hypothetical protein